jgi:hypothetical protein
MLKVGPTISVEDLGWWMIAIALALAIAGAGVTMLGSRLCTRLLQRIVAARTGGVKPD